MPVRHFSLDAYFRSLLYQSNNLSQEAFVNTYGSAMLPEKGVEPRIHVMRVTALFDGLKTEAEME